jgi:integrase
VLAAAPFVFAGPHDSEAPANPAEGQRNESRPPGSTRRRGLEHRPPYALRHSFAAWSIAAGIGLFELARLMGTSVEQIDKTYGHLLPDALDRTRQALDSFVARADEAVAES